MEPDDPDAGPIEFYPHSPSDRRQDAKDNDQRRIYTQFFHYVMKQSMDEAQISADKLMKWMRFENV